MPRRFLLGAAMAGIVAHAQGEQKKSASVIAGTVFRDPGFSFPGVEIVLSEVREGKKPKPQTVVTDSRGEYAFRLPGREAKFKIKASAKGYASEEKETSTTPGVRTEVFFTLKPAVK